MKNHFQSKSVPRGTRTIWRYLSALFILFTFAIGQMWAAEETLTWDGTSLTGVSSTNVEAGTAVAVAGSDGRKVQTIEVYNSVEIASGGSTRKKYNDGWWEDFYSTSCTTSGCTDASTTARIEIPFTIGAGKTFEITNVAFDFTQNGGSGPAVHAFLVQGTTEEWLGYQSATGSANYNPKSPKTSFATFEAGEAKLVFVLGIGANKLGDNRGFRFKNISITGDVADSGAGPVAVTAITIAPSSATIKVGKKVTLVPTITPSNATDKAVTWAVTSGSSYASVTDAGVVTGLAVGTAVVTATAHDGSGVTQTATITVEECPTSGTIYKFQLKTGLTNGNLATSVPTDIEMTTENYLSNLTGGTLTVAARNNVNRVNISNGNAIGFANGDNAYLIMNLDCEIQAGDILKYDITSNDMILMAGSETESTNRMTLSRNVTQVEVDSKLVGADALYMKRSSSSPKISYFEVFRPVYRTITLEYADGVTADGSLDALDGAPATKPTDPTWAHHRFDGWYNGETPYDWTANVTGDLTLTAHWTQLYTITYAAGDGTATGDAPTQVDKAATETFTVAANTFEVAGKDFVNWNDGVNDYDPDDIYTVGTENIVLTAQWKAEADKYTVIFKDGETTLDTKLFEVGSNPSDADIDKTKPLFAFAAWQKDAADIALDDEFWATVVKDASVTLTARWTKAYAQDADLEGLVESEGTGADWQAYLSGKGYGFSTSNVTLDAKNVEKAHANWPYQGLKAKEVGAYVEGRIAADKLVIIKLGHMAAAANVTLDGVAAGTATGLDADEPAGQLNYFYAENEAVLRYETTNAGACVLKAITITDPFQVTFDANGGDDVTSLNGTPSVTLPSATKGTESFLGWFDGETKVGEAGESYTPTANITLKAHWEAISTDARLASIEFSAVGTLSPAFDPEVTNYTYTMPYGTAAVPTITGATSVSAKAKTPVIDAQAANWGDVAHIHGVAESDDTKDYYITMKIAPKDGVSIIKVATTGGTNKTVTGLYAGDGDVNLSSSKKMDNGKYIGFTLDGTTLQAGDQINVHTTTAANTEGSHIIFYDNMTDKNELYETGEIGGTGDNIFEINAAMIGATTAYVYRSNADAAHQWNGYVDFIEVTRAMNPVLTAITIDGRDGEIDALDDKHFSVTIPYEADFAALTVVPTIVRNAAHPTTPEAVISNEGAWILGDNTYRIMDKDGDYTDYTITLDRDVLKHTVSFNTHGGTAIDPVLVAHGEYLAAAPADPTKEDYIFQYWSEDEDGAEVDVATVQINADKEFHAVWVADGAIKLLDGSTVNHTNFITAVTADETVEFQGNTVNYAKFSGTCSGVNSVKDLTRVIAYNATTNKTKIRISAHNNSTSARNILVKGLVEGASAAVDLATIALANKEDKVSDWIEFDNAANRTIYIMVSSSAGDVYFTQVKVVESGETPMKQAGEAGYSLNLNKGRFFGTASTDLAFEGLNARLSGDYTALNSGYAKLNATSMSFTVASDMNLVVTTNNSKTYYVTKGAAGTDNETAKTGVSEFDLTAGTWYITAGSSEVQFTNIAFAAPKCEQPTITPMSNSDLCEGNAFEALTVTASVSDGGTLHYAWFKEAGADDEAVGTDAASYTPEADGEYYVVVTNRLADHSDNSATSNTITVTHFASAVITSAPMNQRAEAGNAVTLTVAATGKNVSYKWYTCDEDGSNEVALDPAETGTSLNVTVTAGMNQWYKVIVTSDCGNAEAKAKVSEFQPTTPATVTESIVWDWTSSVWPASGTAAFTNEDAPDYELLADADAIVPNAEGFRSDMLYGKGQYVWRSGNKFFQGTAIKFTSIVAGMVRVYFRSTKEGRTVNVAINGTDAGSRTNSFGWSSYVEVPAGEVEILCTGDGYTRVQKIEFLEIIDSRTEYAAGDLGTACYEYDALVIGATPYMVAGVNGNGYIVFDEITSGVIDAGYPYLFEAAGGKVFFCKPVGTTAAPLVSGEETSVKGMIGTFSGTTLTQGEDDICYFAGRHIWRVNDFSVNIDVDPHRCYVNYDVLRAVPAAPAAAPGRRRVIMGVNGKDEAQGFENLDASETPMKVMIDGTLYILRGEKVFDATGRLVK